MRRVLVAAVAMCMASFAACGGESGSTGGAAKSGGEADPVVVGMPIAQTGVMSFYDVPSHRTAQIAVDEINDSGGILGRPVKLSVADTKSELNLIQTAAIKVIQDGAQFMVPTVDYDFGGPAAREAQKADIIAMSIAGDPRYGRTGIGSNFFNMFPGGPTEGAVAATFASTTKGWRNAYVLEDPSLSYSKAFTKYFRYSWDKLGGAVVGSDSFENDDPSIATQITRLKAASPKPDFIFMGSYAPGGATATKQIRAAGVQLPIVSGVGFDGTFWTGAVPNISDFYAVVGGVTTEGAEPNKHRAELYDKYRAAYHEDPPIGEHTMAGYSAIQAWKIAVERAKSFDTAKVRAELEKFEDVQLANRKVTWSDTCHLVTGAPMPVVEFVNGKEKFVTEQRPEFVQSGIC